MKIAGDDGGKSIIFSNNEDTLKISIMGMLNDEALKLTLLKCYFILRRLKGGNCCELLLYPSKENYLKTKKLFLKTATQEVIEANKRCEKNWEILAKGGK